MNNEAKIKLVAIFEALVVTFLWSTSFIIIKIGLVEITPITFAGLRYFLAFIFFVPIITKKRYTEEIKKLSKENWKKLFLLGIIFYTLTQGFQFIGLSLLPAVTVSLILNFTPLVVAVLGMMFLKEKPGIIQGLGIILFLIGVSLYFLPIIESSSSKLGITIMIFGVFTNACSSVMGRNINMKKEISPIVVTFISMGIGSILLLSIAVIVEDPIHINMRNVLVLIWLSLINTAFAFTLWNLSLRTLKAIESSIINGTMLVQIALLSWLFLDERISLTKCFGLFIAASGVILVQIKKTSSKPNRVVAEENK